MGESLEPAIDAVFDSWCQDLPSGSMTRQTFTVHLVQCTFADSALACKTEDRMTHFVYQSVQEILHSPGLRGRRRYDTYHVVGSSGVVDLLRPFQPPQMHHVLYVSPPTQCHNYPVVLSETASHQGCGRRAEGQNSTLRDNRSSRMSGTMPFPAIERESFDYPKQSRLEPLEDSPGDLFSCICLSFSINTVKRRIPHSFESDSMAVKCCDIWSGAPLALSWQGESGGILSGIVGPKM